MLKTTTANSGNNRGITRSKNYINAYLKTKQFTWKELKFAEEISHYWEVYTPTLEA